jgi:hypothetical protein
VGETESAAPRPDRIRQLQSAVAPAFALLAGMELDLFSAIGDGKRQSAELAGILEVSESRLVRLLDALVVTGLLERAGEAYRNSAETRTFLVRGARDDMRAEQELLRQLWQADMKTAESIRSGRPEAEHDFAGTTHETAAAFQRGLLPSTLQFGRELAEAVAIEPNGSALDVGGGPAGVLLSLAERYPHLKLTLLELPPVARIVKPMLAASQHAGRIQLEEGNIVAGPARAIHDLVILKAVAQVLSPEQAASAIRNCFASLKPWGTLVVGGAGILDDTRMSPPSAVYYNLTFMNLYRAGGSYTQSQYRFWLSSAGFTNIRFVTLASGATVLCADRP